MSRNTLKAFFFSFLLFLTLCAKSARANVPDYLSIVGPEPRKHVQERLAADVSCLGFYVFPYLAEGIKNDKSLEAVVNIFKAYSCFSIKGDFQSWWEANKERYSFPEAKGWDHALNILKQEKLAVYKSARENMPTWHELAESYYAGNNIKRYWYYFLSGKDEILEEDVIEAICKATEDK